LGLPSYVPQALNKNCRYKMMYFVLDLELRQKSDQGPIDILTWLK